jgi:hypothetical protein
MSDQLSDRLYEEMAGMTRPPAVGLVEGAVSRANVIRRRRRVASGAGTTAVIGAVAAVVALGGQVLPSHRGSVSGVAGAAPTTVTLAKPSSVMTATATPSATLSATPSATPAAVPAPAATTDVQALINAQLAKLKADKPGTAGAGADKEKLAALGQWGALATPSALPPGVPATPAGMLELLTSLLPAGSSNPGVANDGSLGVETYVATSSGPAMVRAGLARATYVPVGCGSQAGCTVAPNGDIVTVRSIANNCPQNEDVDVIHPDGSEVAVYFGACLQWDGTRNPPSPQAMTLDQAKAIAMDPRWDVSMNSALVSAGAAHFPSPHLFG